MGAYAARVKYAGQIADAVRGALHAVQDEHRPALLHVIVDPAMLLPPKPAQTTS